MLDDLFLVHESLVPMYLNVGERAMFAGYGLMTLLYLARFRTTILKTDFLILFAAFGFFGLSLVIDRHLVSLQEHHLFEDGFKLLGIVSWSSYYAAICIKLIWKMPESGRQLAEAHSC